MEDYFKDVEEESIRDNFVIIYELLDELVDFGYPQTTDGKILQEYITQESHKLDLTPKPPPGMILKLILTDNWIILKITETLTKNLRLQIIIVDLNTDSELSVLLIILRLNSIFSLANESIPILLHRVGLVNSKLLKDVISKTG